MISENTLGGMSAISRGLRYLRSDLGNARQCSSMIVNATAHVTYVYPIKEIGGSS